MGHERDAAAKTPEAMKAKHYILAGCFGVFIALPAFGDVGRYIWGAVFVVAAVGVCLVALAGADERKKKEHLDRLSRLPALMATVAELEAQIAALHKENLAPATPTKETGNAEPVAEDDFDRIFIHAADGTMRQVGERKESDQKRGNALELEINE